jgi:hypothetical protein
VFIYETPNLDKISATFRIALLYLWVLKVNENLIWPKI